jgi:hypothetical protein
MSSGSQPLGMILVLLIGVYGCVYVAVDYNVPGTTTAAQDISKVLRKLPIVDSSSLGPVNQVPGASNINSAIKDINSHFGTNFESVNVTVIQLVEVAIPILQPYNDLIGASINFNASNKASVQAIYVDVFFLAGTAVLSNAAFAYHFSYNTVGIMNDLLKIGKLQSYCEDCYSLVLHWLYLLVSNSLPYLLPQFIQLFPDASQN